jgi:hypothetical protein
LTCNHTSGAITRSVTPTAATASSNALAAVTLRDLTTGVPVTGAVISTFLHASTRCDGP